MCGIAGFIDFSAKAGADELARLARLMSDAIRHRGPDDEGVFADPAFGLGLSHRRLSILDLSPEGRQPMVSASGRYRMVFNGEIYNFAEVRRAVEAAGHGSWRGHSDTEVMLAAFEAWGVREALPRFAGMFAFAVWDRSGAVLTLARDRFGEKPLFYGRSGPVFLFGSELKALAAHPAFRGEVDRQALAGYLRYGYVPCPATIWEGFHQVPPGSYLEIEAGKGRGAGEPQPYWSLAERALAAMADPFRGTEEEAADELERLLRGVVRDEMVSDVPLGAFLSGGIDSSLIAALMQAESARPVRTFTIGFTDPAWDESASAEAVARHLGTDHTTLTAEPKDALEVIPKLAEMYDQPFSDASQIPTHLVSKLTRRHVTVALSGDGGDEMFAGYNRHFWGPMVWGRLAGIPLPLRRAMAAAATALSPSDWDRLYGLGSPLLPGRFRQRLPGHKLHKLAGVASARSREDLYVRLTSTWSDPCTLLTAPPKRGTGGARPPRPPEAIHPRLSLVPPVEDYTLWMQLADAATYLPDDILTKVDRAGMAVSLETRAPYLDHRVAEFAWRLPLAFKIGSGQGKRILRRILYRHVPRELVERPKMGFGVPVGEWLRGPLRDWAENLLNEDRLRREGYLDPAPVRRTWAEHQTGRFDHAYRLWNALMFQEWAGRWL